MKMTFRLDGLGCANCASKMETALNKLEGVKEASVNFMTTKMVIEGEDDKMSEIISKAEKIIKKIEPDTVMKRA